MHLTRKYKAVFLLAIALVFCMCCTPEAFADGAAEIEGNFTNPVKKIIKKVIGGKKTDEKNGKTKAKNKAGKNNAPAEKGYPVFNGSNGTTATAPEPQKDDSATRVWRVGPYVGEKKNRQYIENGGLEKHFNRGKRSQKHTYTKKTTTTSHPSESDVSTLQYAPSRRRFSRSTKFLRSGAAPKNQNSNSYSSSYSSHSSSSTQDANRGRSPNSSMMQGGRRNGGVNTGANSGGFSAIPAPVAPWDWSPELSKPGYPVYPSRTLPYPARNMCPAPYKDSCPLMIRQNGASNGSISNDVRYANNSSNNASPNNFSNANSEKKKSYSSYEKSSNIEKHSKKYAANSHLRKTPIHERVAPRSQLVIGSFNKKSGDKTTTEFVSEEWEDGTSYKKSPSINRALKDESFENGREGPYVIKGSKPFRTEPKQIYNKETPYIERYTREDSEQFTTLEEYLKNGGKGKALAVKTKDGVKSSPLAAAIAADAEKKEEKNLTFYEKVKKKVLGHAHAETTHPKRNIKGHYPKDEKMHIATIYFQPDNTLTNEDLDVLKKIVEIHVKHGGRLRIVGDIGAKQKDLLAIDKDTQERLAIPKSLKLAEQVVGYLNGMGVDKKNTLASAGNIFDKPSGTKDLPRNPHKRVNIFLEY